MKNKFISKSYGLIFLILSIIFTVFFVMAKYNGAEQTAVTKTVYEITKGYRINQILATMGMYFVGLITVYPLCIKLGEYFPFLVAMPAGNALWGMISSLLLFLNIPYNKVTTLGLVAIIILFELIRYKETYRDVDKIKTMNICIVVLGVIIMASSGMFPKYYSSDSFYYIMQYGQLITENGALSSDIVGTYMTWTGITPALISSFAAMFGFETIYGIHHLLVFSMYGFITLFIYETANSFFSKRMTWILTLGTLVTVVFTPIVTGLATWIISNTYFMVYIVFFLMFPIIARERMDMKVVCLMALFAGWMTLCRIEAAPYMCFLVICITCLNMPRKQSVVLYFTVLVFEILYLLKVLYEHLTGGRQALEQELTIDTAVVILLVLFVTGCYFLVYNVKIIEIIRGHMVAVGIIVLLIGCLVLGLFDWERFVNNVMVAGKNVLTNWYWPLPVAIAACEILKTCFKCRNQYLDLAVWGSVLFNFAICMGRINNLRLGLGDSYHRVCISLVPLYIVSTIYIFLIYFRNLQNSAETMGGIEDNEIDYPDSML